MPSLEKAYSNSLLPIFLLGCLLFSYIDLYELFADCENFYLLLININLNDYLIQLQNNFKYVWKNWIC